MFKIVLNINAKIVVERVQRERTALLKAGLPYWHYLLDVPPMKLSTVSFLNKVLQGCAEERQDVQRSLFQFCKSTNKSEWLKENQATQIST